MKVEREGHVITHEEDTFPIFWCRSAFFRFLAFPSSNLLIKVTKKLTQKKKSNREIVALGTEQKSLSLISIIRFSILTSLSIYTM